MEEKTTTATPAAAPAAPVAKKPIRKKINAKRKALNSKYEKILKLIEIVEGSN